MLQLRNIGSDGGLRYRVINFFQIHSTSRTTNLRSGVKLIIHLKQENCAWENEPWSAWNCQKTRIQFSLKRGSFLFFIYPPVLGSCALQLPEPSLSFLFLSFCLSFCVCYVWVQSGVGGPQGNRLRSFIGKYESPSPPRALTTRGEESGDPLCRADDHCPTGQGWKWYSRSARATANHLSSTSVLSQAFQRFSQHTVLVEPGIRTR